MKYGKALLVLCVCAGLTALATEARAELRKDIEYARPGGASLTLDASVPEGAGPFPTVIVVHGGGFARGTKTSYVTPLFEPLTKAGFTWFTINYRLAPANKFPAPVEDVTEAIRWVKAHAKEYKADPNRIALIGESAGAHLVAFVGAKPEPGAKVKAVVPFYCPCDLLSLSEWRKKISPDLQDFIGVGPELSDPQNVEMLKKASPVTYVHRGMPPFLFIHGTADVTVDPAQSPEMCDAIKKSGSACEVYNVEGGTHGMGGWDKIPNGSAYKQKLIDWLKANL